MRTRKKNKTKSLLQAEKEHIIWLEQMGLSPKQLKATKKSRGRVVDFPDLKTNSSSELSNSVGVGTKKEPNKYSGTLIMGISTMHKSNAVPVINEKQAKEIASMRRN